MSNAAFSSSESESSEEGEVRQNFKQASSRPTVHPHTQNSRSNGRDDKPEIPQDLRVPFEKCSKRKMEEVVSEDEGNGNKYRFSFTMEEIKKIQKIMGCIEHEEVRDIGTYIKAATLRFFSTDQFRSSAHLWMIFYIRNFVS